MNTLLFLVINGLAAIQFVNGQGAAKTAWAASMGGGGGSGLGFHQFQEPTPDMIRIAVHQITIAPTEQAVLNAGVTVHRPGRDLSDQVVDAIEQRIAELRTPPGWLHRLPPPLPSWFDAARAVEAAYNGQPTASFMAAMPSLTPAMGAFGAAAAMGAGGAAGTMGAAGSAATRMGMGPLRPGFQRFAEPRNYEVNIAINDINAATTEAGAAKAAAMVHRPGIDMADAVVNAFENKIAQLRALPRLPMRFNPLPLIMAAYNMHWAKQFTAATTGTAKRPAAPKQSTRAAFGPGPPRRPAFGPGPPRRPAFGPGPPRRTAFGPGPQNQGPPSPNQINRNMRNWRPPPGSGRNRNRFPGPPPTVQRTLRKPRAPPKDLSGLPERYKRPLMELHKMAPKNQPPPREPQLPNRYRQKIQRRRDLQRNAPRDPPTRSLTRPPTRPPTQPPTRPPTYPPPSAPPTNPPAHPKKPAPTRPTSFQRNRPSDYPADPKVPSAPPQRRGPSPAPPSARRPPSQNAIPKQVSDFAPPLDYPPPPKQVAEPRIKDTRRIPPVKKAQETKLAPKLSDVLFAGNDNQFQSVPADLTPKSLWKPMVDLGVEINDIVSNSGKGATYKTSFSAPDKNLLKKKKKKMLQLRAAPTSTEFGVSTPRPIKAPQTTTTPPPTPPNPRNHLNMLKNGDLKKTVEILRKDKAKKKPTGPAERPTKPTPPKSPDGNKMTQLKTLLEGIAPSKLQAIVDILKNRDGGSSLAGPSAPVDAPAMPSRPRGPPPPPPGSSNFGPGREVRGGRRGGGRRRPSSGPSGGGSSRADPRGDPRGPFSSRDMGGRGGPGGPGGPGGDPWSSRRNGPSGGPPNNGMTPELMARMQRVLKRGLLLGPRRGAAAAAAGGEAPEAPEGGQMNPLMMAMMMKGMPGAAGGGEAGAGGAAGLAQLLGAGGGGANPLLNMLGGGGGAAGEGPSGMNMQSLMMQAALGGGGGGGGETPSGSGLGGLGALAGMGGMGGMGSLASLMGGPAAEGAGAAGLGALGMNLFGAGASV